MSQTQPPGLLEQMITRLGFGRTMPRGRHGFRVNDAFLSDDELSFYHSLCEAAGKWAVVCPKVALADLLTADEPDRFGQIDGRRVDFVLCGRETMRPLLAVALDSEPAHDTLLDEVLGEAGLVLKRVPVQSTYAVAELAAGLKQAVGIDEAAEQVVQGTNGSAARNAPAKAPTCPLCGRLMILRTVARPGPYEGKQFWACADYPQCRGVREYRTVK